MDSVRTIFEGLDWSIWLDVLMSIIPALLCITFHELSHGLVAYRLGDDTAKQAGRLTLNPLKHIDIMGLIMMAVFHFGWAKPVPVNMMNFKNPRRGMALTALAGPCSNLILAIFFLFIYGLLFRAVPDIVLELIYTTAYLSIALGIFNLIPVPPLDGSKILFSALSDEWYFKLMRYERYGMIIMVVLIATGILGTPLSRAVSYVFGGLFNVIAQAGFDLAGLFIR